MTTLDARVRERLRGLRKAQRLRQADAAAAVGWAQPTISKYEMGELSTDLDTLDALARFYGSSLVQILAEAPAPAADASFETLRAAYLRLDPAGRAHLVAVVEGLAALAPPRAPSRRRP